MFNAILKLSKCANVIDLHRLKEQWAAKGFELYMHSTCKPALLNSTVLLTGGKIPDKDRTNPGSGDFVYGFQYSESLLKQMPYGPYWLFFTVPKGVNAVIGKDGVIKCNDNVDVVGTADMREFEDNEKDKKKK